jgi:hypothetical protein
MTKSECNLLCAWERQAHLIHDFCNAYRCRSGYTHSTMNEGGATVFLSSFYGVVSHVSYGVLQNKGLTNELQTSLKLSPKRINTIILDSINHHQILRRPIKLPHNIFWPGKRFSNTQDARDAKFAKKLWVIRMAQVSEVHVWQYSARQAAVNFGKPSGFRKVEDTLVETR